MRTHGIVGLVVAGVLSAGANASAAPIPTWTGFYVGLHAGYGWGDVDYVASPLTPNPPFAVTQSFEMSGSVVRAGISYRFSL